MACVHMPLSPPSHFLGSTVNARLQCQVVSLCEVLVLLAFPACPFPTSPFPCPTSPPTSPGHPPPVPCTGAERACAEAD